MVYFSVENFLWDWLQFPLIVELSINILMMWLLASVTRWLVDYFSIFGPLEHRKVAKNCQTLKNLNYLTNISPIWSHCFWFTFVPRLQPSQVHNLLTSIMLKRKSLQCGQIWNFFKVFGNFRVFKTKFWTHFGKYLLPIGQNLFFLTGQILNK